MIFGRISGANAAAVKDDVTQDSLLEGEGFKPTVAERSYECSENQYIGYGMGKGMAPMAVRVTIEDGTITNVEVLEHWETLGWAAIDRAFATLPQAIIDANGTDVDMVSGATRTSAGIIAAVADAMAQAGM